MKIGKNIRRVGADAFYGTPFWEKQGKKANGYVYLDYILLGYDEDLGKPNRKQYKVKSGTSVLADVEWYFTEKLQFSIRTISLPEGLEVIGKGLFSDCKNLKMVTIPKSVTKIKTDAFADKSIQFTVYKGSYAETYLKKNGFKSITVKA